VYRDGYIIQMGVNLKYIQNIGREMSSKAAYNKAEHRMVG
jgi:hypothetical protein